MSCLLPHGITLHKITDKSKVNILVQDKTALKCAKIQQIGSGIIKRGQSNVVVPLLAHPAIILNSLEYALDHILQGLQRLDSTTSLLLAILFLCKPTLLTIQQHLIKQILDPSQSAWSEGSLPLGSVVHSP